MMFTAINLSSPPKLESTRTAFPFAKHFLPGAHLGGVSNRSIRSLESRPTAAYDSLGCPNLRSKVCCNQSEWSYDLEESF